MDGAPLEAHVGRRALAATGVVALAGVGVEAARRLRRVTTGQTADGGGPRELVVTVNRPPEEVAPQGQFPDQLTALGDQVDLNVRPAPGGKGAELAARVLAKQPAGLRGAARRVAGKDPRQDVRRALREAKSVLETGEVLEAQRPGTTERTLLGLPIDLATRRSAGEGQL